MCLEKNNRVNATDFQMQKNTPKLLQGSQVQILELHGGLRYRWVEMHTSSTTHVAMQHLWFEREKVELLRPSRSQKPCMKRRSDPRMNGLHHGNRLMK